MSLEFSLHTWNWSYLYSYQGVPMVQMRAEYSEVVWLCNWGGVGGGGAGLGPFVNLNVKNTWPLSEGLWEKYVYSFGGWNELIVPPDLLFPFFTDAGAKRSFPDEPLGQGVVVQAISVLWKECPRDRTSVLPLALPLASSPPQEASEIQPVGKRHITAVQSGDEELSEVLRTPWEKMP